MNVGSKIGAYEVVAKLGEGGMGEVYHARDTNLDRAVALKILPDAFTQDGDRVRRFEREAKTLATLNHPHIAQIYGFDGRALAMELVDGDDLAAIIARGRVVSHDALAIARQIANALEAAHEQGVIHRDLKPANIKVRPDGTVKVLDFGLARADGSAGPGGEALTSSPTITSPTMTAAGMILGTAAYMSPEQAKGRVADKRSDLWSFGCVLYEMLTGVRAFGGEDVADTLAFILTKEPDWGRLPADLPAGIRTLLHRCLTKDRKQRLDSAAAARLEIDDAVTTPRHDQSTVPSRSVGGTRARDASLAVAGLAIAIAAGSAGWQMRSAPGRLPAQFAITLPDGETFSGANRHHLALSPDGRHVAYVAGNRLYLRPLNRIDATVLAGAGVDGKVGPPRSPFFSPDGQWLGFWQGGYIRKVSVSGGAPTPVCAAEGSPEGVSWGTDNNIYVGGLAGIQRVSADGGNLEFIITLDPAHRTSGPQLLPDGRTILYTLRRTPGTWDAAEIVAQPLDGSGTPQALITGADGRYVPTGHLLYALRETVLAVPFDVAALRTTGTPVPVMHGVRRQVPLFAASQFTFSADGTLAYIPSRGDGPPPRPMVWVHRDGREEAIPTAPAHPYASVRLDPSGTRVALDVWRDDNRDIWVWDFTRESMTTVTTHPTADVEPVWTPDGKRIIFSSDRLGTGTALFWQPVDAAADAELLLPGPAARAFGTHGTSLILARRGRNLLMTDLRDPSRPMLPVGESDLTPLTQATKFADDNAAVSPDGRWLAYQSNISGSIEVYLQPFPAGERVVISTGGGAAPKWARDSRELFYRAPDGAVMRVATASGAAPGKPTRLFAGTQYGTGRDSYDIAADGRRFLMLKNATTPADREAVERIIVIQNWLDELRAKVPASR